jgi:hypothetical protein
MEAAFINVDTAVVAADNVCKEAHKAASHDLHASRKFAQSLRQDVDADVGLCGTFRLQCLSAVQRPLQHAVHQSEHGVVMHLEQRSRSTVPAVSDVQHNPAFLETHRMTPMHSHSLVNEEGATFDGEGAGGAADEGDVAGDGETGHFDLSRGELNGDIMVADVLQYAHQLFAKGSGRGVVGCFELVQDHGGRQVLERK